MCSIPSKISDVSEQRMFSEVSVLLEESKVSADSAGA